MVGVGAGSKFACLELESQCPNVLTTECHPVTSEGAKVSVIYGEAKPMAPAISSLQEGETWAGYHPKPAFHHLHHIMLFSPNFPQTLP